MMFAVIALKLFLFSGFIPGYYFLWDETVFKPTGSHLQRLDTAAWGRQVEHSLISVDLWSLYFSYLSHTVVYQNLMVKRVLFKVSRLTVDYFNWTFFFHLHLHYRLSHLLPFFTFCYTDKILCKNESCRTNISLLTCLHTIFNLFGAKAYQRSNVKFW